MKSVKKLLPVLVSAVLFPALSCADESKPPPPIDSAGTDDGGESTAAAPFCGDGIAQETNHELCDGTDGEYIGHNCSQLGWGTGTVSCDNSMCLYTGCSDLPSFDDWGAGVDETGTPPECEPTMVNYSCNGVAYGVYKDTASEDRIMEVAGDSISTSRVLACIGDLVDAPPSQHHLVTLDACGPNSDGVEAMVQQQCEMECPLKFAEGSPFREDFQASGRTWEFEEVRCVFGEALNGSGTLDPELINSISQPGAVTYTGCDMTGAPHLNPGTMSDPVMPCGGSTCAEIDCTDYQPDAYVGNTGPSKTTIRSWANSLFAEQLLDSMMLPFCGEGLYVWNSDQPTQARFEGLGSGELFYELGFRTGDRLLTIREYVPSTSDPSKGTLVGTEYPLTTQGGLLTAVTALDLLEPGEHFFRIKFKRGIWGSTTWYNWIRVIDIPV